MSSPNSEVQTALDHDKLIIVGSNNSNKTMVLFAEIGFDSLKPKTQCIGQKKLGVFHPWHFPTLPRAWYQTRLHKLEARLGPWS